MLRRVVFDFFLFIPNVGYFVFLLTFVVCFRFHLGTKANVEKYATLSFFETFFGILLTL